MDEVPRTTVMARTLSAMPNLWGRLLVDHVPDGGGRCRACTRGGTGIPGARWPCSIRLIADEARRLHRTGERV